MRNKMKLLIILFLSILVIPFHVEALEDITLEVDQENLKPGDKVTVKVDTNYQKTLYGFSASLSYDEEVFEVLEEDDFLEQKDWDDVTYNENNHRFALLNKTGTVRDYLFEVTLRVKDNPVDGDTTIILKDVVASNGEKDIEFRTIRKTLDIDNPEYVGKDSYREKEEVVENEKEAFALRPFFIIGIILLILLILLIGIIHIPSISKKLKKNGNFEKIRNILIGLCIIPIILLIITSFTKSQRGDVNEDKNTDYDDAEKIVEYLIDIQNDISLKEQYDVNGDGKITITDAANVEKNTTNKTNYRVTLGMKKNYYYVSKKEDVKVQFQAKINPNQVIIKEVYLNGQKVKVYGNTDGYSIPIKAFSNAGQYQYTITKVVLSNDREVDINDISFIIDVLKDTPGVDQFTASNKKVSFEFLDDDESLKKAHITIFKGEVKLEDFDVEDLDHVDNVGDFQVVVGRDISYSGKIDINVSLNLGEVYTVIISGNYDLDSDKKDTTNTYEDEILYYQTFTYGSVQITPLMEYENTYYAKGENVLFSFNALVLPEEHMSQMISKAVVGGEEKDVTYVDGHFEIVLDAGTNYGEKNTSITYFVLDDGTVVTCQYDIRYHVLKERPKIENIMYHDSTKKINFTLTDPDKTVSKAKLIITNQDTNKVVFEKELDISHEKFEFETNLEEGYHYTAKVEGTYDLDDDSTNGKNEYTDSYTHQFTIHKILVENNESEIYYVSKGGNVDFKFSAKVLPEDEESVVTAVTIDQEVYTPTRLEDGTYQVSYKAPTTSGRKNIKVSKITLGDEDTGKKITFHIDVLKDAPELKKFLIDETKADPTVSFTIEDSEEAFIDGEITLRMGEEVIKALSVHTGDNLFKLSQFTDEFEEEEKYYFDIKIHYDLDSLKDNGKNEKNQYVLKDQKVIFYDAELTLLENDYYAQKGEEKTILLSASIPDQDLTIRSFVMKDKTVVAAKKVNGNYAITIVSPNKAGLKTYEIQNIIFNNGIEIEIDHAPLSFTLDVLKTSPKVNHVTLGEDNRSFSYALDDPDSAFIDGGITITDESNDVIIQQELKTSDTIEHRFKEDATYTVVVKGSYNLSNKKDDKTHYHENGEMYQNSFLIGGSYYFTLSDLSITDAVKEGENVVLSFQSTNARDAVLTKAVVNGKTYDVTQVNPDEYQIILTGIDMSYGKHEVVLESIEADTLKEFVKGKDFVDRTLTYTVLKNAPSVSSITLSEKKDNHTIQVQYELVDSNRALTGGKFVLVDSTSKIISSYTLTDEELLSLGKGQVVSLSYDKNMDGKYTVRFLADYHLGDQYQYNSQKIGAAEIFLENSDIYIDNIIPKTLYATKNQKNFEISYEVYVGDSIKTSDGRTYTRLSMITINGKNYVANGESTNRPKIYRSKVGITSPNEGGVYTLSSNRVQLELNSYYHKANNFYSVKDNSVQIEVLKDAPKIENLKVASENYKNKSVTFEFDVVVDEKAVKDDESFKEGYVLLGEAKEKIVRGHNKVTFKDIVVDSTLNLVFQASYDLDTDYFNKDGSKDENEFVLQPIYETKYGLFDQKSYDDIQIKDAKAVSVDGDSYFEKNEEVTLQFNITGDFDQLGFYPQSVKVGDKEITLQKVEDHYEIKVDSYKAFGIKNIEITDIIFQNGKVLTLEKPVNVSFEILKDAPSVTSYQYEVNTGLLKNKIKVTSKLKDSDGAIVVGDAIIIVKDDKGKDVLHTTYDEDVEFTKDKDVTRYTVQVISDYDLDTNAKKGSKHYVVNQVLLDEVISFEENDIELKDINDINLYQKTSDGIQLIDEVSVKNLNSNKKNYFVEIHMDQMPSVRAEIKSVEEEDHNLVLVLDYEYLRIEDKTTDDLRIVYGAIQDNKANNETHPDAAFNALLKKLKENKDVTLTQNYDASSIGNDPEVLYYIENYTGTLDGDGYTIRNLQKPLFNTIKNATIKNIRFEDVTMPGTNGHGTVANNAENSKLTSVFVHKYNKQNAESQVGILVGKATKTTFEQCAATDFNTNAGWNNLQQLGGIVGTSTECTIKDCYASGKIPGGWNYRGGLAGNSSNSTFENNFIKVDIGYGMGDTMSYDITGGSNNIFKNNVSMTTGFTHRVCNAAKECSGNYYVDTTNAEDINQQGATRIGADAFHKGLFTQAKFDEKIWNLEGVSIENTPTFQVEKFLNLKGVDHKDFKEKDINLYHNLAKLMPFYSTDKIIEISKNVKDEYLKNQEITHIVPFDSKGNVVSYVTTANSKRIDHIRILYKNGEVKEYKVVYDNTYDMVVSYHINELGIDYTYNHYLIDSNSQVVNDLTNYLKGLNYTENLDVLTSTEDSRIYKEFYEEVTEKELKEFVLKYLSNSNYTNTNDHKVINEYLENSIRENNRIEKVLYVYNYFRRFYDLDIDGMKLYDFMVFHMDGFDATLTPEKMADLYLADGNNFNTGATGTRYASVLSTYTKQATIAKFLEFMVEKFGDGDLDQWTRDQFKGYLVELPVKGHDNKDNPDYIQYTLWDHFSNEDANYKPHRAYDMMLPILTLPERSAYIISSPVQYVIGAQRSYIEDPFNEQQQDILRRRIKSYSDRMSTYYNTAYEILGDVKLFNDIHTFHLDKRFAYDENGAMVYQQIGTEEPFHKNFNEVTNRWQTSDGNAAVAWGDRIDWSAEGLLDGNIDPELVDVLHKELQEYTYHTFTHETAHNIDARLFLMNQGRRFDAGGEDYADSNLMQSFGPNDIVMNISVHYDKGTEIGSNWDPSRINSQEKIYDYYNKVFNTIYVMDYIEAQAFLQLSDEDKAEIGIKVIYPNEEKYKDEGNKFRARQTTAFTQISVDEWKKMKLDSIDDLIDNQIMKYAGVYQYASRGSNSYGGEGLNTAHWYQPNNPDGRPDSYALKWIAYEMLGYKGYQDGYVEYYSNIHSETKQIYKNVDNPAEGNSMVSYKTDNMAIEKISNGQYHNIDEYKKARFKETAEKLPYLRSDVNIQEYVQKLYDAMVKDAYSTRVDLADKLAKDPNCLKDYWCIRNVAERRSYPESTKVRREIYYKLKNATNDFESDIFEKTVQQNGTNFTVKKS